MIRSPGADRIQSPQERPEEDVDATLRPRLLEEFIGQEALKEQLGVSIAAAAARGEALDHVLLAGPPGLGKTSLAQIVAAELDVPFVQTAGPALERKADIASFLTALESRAVFFVDEIHRLPRAVEETFYPAMEDRRLPITVGAGAGARVVTLELPAFTLIGATTRAGLLTTPLRDRFGIQHRLDHYDTADLARIVTRSARVLDVRIDADGARRDRRARPRHAARRQPAAAPRARLRAGERRHADRRRRGRRRARPARGRPRRARPARPRDPVDDLQRFSGGPVGLSTLAVAVQEESDTIEDVYEPYLLQQGFLIRTPRGRVRDRPRLPPPRPRARG